MKNKRELTTMLKEAAIMFAITLIAGLALGFTYQLTKEPIRIQQEKKMRQACQEVFADASEFTIIAVTPHEELLADLESRGVTVGKVYETTDSSAARLGYVIEVSTRGYEKPISIYLGVRNDGTLNGVSIVEIAETPGLGMRAEEVLVPQFAGKQVKEFTYTKVGSQSDSEIDAISSATVTTKAFVNAVNAGLKFFAEELMQEGGESNE